jgi:hypothetical protein
MGYHASQRAVWGRPTRQNAKTRKSENAKGTKKDNKEARKAGICLLVSWLPHYDLPIPGFFRVFALSRFRVLILSSFFASQHPRSGALPGSQSAYLPA